MNRRRDTRCSWRAAADDVVGDGLAPVAYGAVDRRATVAAVERWSGDVSRAGPRPGPRPRRRAASFGPRGHVGRRCRRRRGRRPRCRRRRSPGRSPTSLTTSRSQPLRASLARPWARTSPSASPVSAAKPTTTWPGARRGDQLGEDVGGCAPARSASGSRRRAFLILRRATSPGRKSATAAAITTASASGGRLEHGLAQLRGGADPDDRRRPAGSGSATLAATRVTSAPRAAAVRGERVALPAARSGCRGSGPGRGARGCRRR